MGYQFLATARGTQENTLVSFFPSFIYLKAFVYLFIDCFYYYLFIVYYYYCLFIVYHWQARRARPLIRRSHMVTGPVPGVPCLRSPSTMPRSPRCPRDRVGHQVIFKNLVLTCFDLFCGLFGEH